MDTRTTDSTGPAAATLPAAPEPADTEPTSGGASYRARGPDRVRIGIVLGGFLALVLAAAVTLGASPAPGSSASPGQGSGSGGGAPAFPFGGVLDRAGRLGALRTDLAARLGMRFGQVTIAAIDGSKVSLKTEDGWTRTITVTSSTTITKAGRTVPVSDLKVGDAIRFRQTRNNDGSFTINAIEVVLPRVVGAVTQVTADGFAIRARDGSTWSISVDGSTTYTLGGLSARNGSRSDVKVGSEVLVQGTQSSGNAMSAARVFVAQPRVAGQVTAKTNDTITVRRANGTSATIKVGTDTTYRVRGVASPTLADVKVGMVVVAEGTQNSDGSLSATSVAAGERGGRAKRNLPGPFRAPKASPSPATPG